MEKRLLSNYGNTSWHSSSCRRVALEVGLLFVAGIELHHDRGEVCEAATAMLCDTEEFNLEGVLLLHVLVVACEDSAADALNTTEPSTIKLRALAVTLRLLPLGLYNDLHPLQQFISDVLAGTLTISCLRLWNHLFLHQR
jgi:hypothetical protein